MYNNYDYPAGADMVDAPWNQPLSELYDWACSDEEQDILDKYDE